jgi:hypothetical protein
MRDPSYSYRRDTRMKESGLHKACRLVFCAGLLNFVLFFLVSLLIGGDAFNGRIDENRCYLGGHGRYTEVSCLLYTYSRVHETSLLITHAAAMLASLLYWVTGGGQATLTFVTPAVRTPPRNRMLRALHVLRSRPWQLVDAVEGVCSRLLDSWRSPDVEFFTRLSKNACIAKLSHELDCQLLSDQGAAPISGSLMGSHFYLVRLPPVYVRIPSVALFGKLASTAQGTYVRAWHRLPAAALVLLAVVAWLAITLLPLTVRLPARLNSPVLVSGVAALTAAILSIVLVWLSSRIGRRRNSELVGFVVAALEDAA